MPVSVTDDVVVFIVDWHLVVVHLFGVALLTQRLSVPDVGTFPAVPLPLKQSYVFKPSLPLTMDAITFLKDIEGLECLRLLRVGLFVVSHPVGRLTHTPVTLADFAGMEVLSVPVGVLLLIFLQKMGM